MLLYYFLKSGIKIEIILLGGWLKYYKVNFNTHCNRYYKSLSLFFFIVFLSWPLILSEISLLFKLNLLLILWNWHLSKKTPLLLSCLRLPTFHLFTLVHCALQTAEPISVPLHESSGQHYVPTVTTLFLIFPWEKLCQLSTQQ